jgi:mono/diheme cytochrome c family protein
VALKIGVLLTLAAALQSSDLAPGEGRELVLSACTGCHTTEIITSSHMSRKSWDATLTWMEETQGLNRLEPSLRKAILDYLEKTQGLTAEQEESSSPWASPRYGPNPIW